MTEKNRRKKIPTGGRIPRAYSRVAVVPPHRVAEVYPPVEVMRQAEQQTTEKNEK